MKSIQVKLYESNPDKDIMQCRQYAFALGLNQKPLDKILLMAQFETALDKLLEDIYEGN